MEYALFVAEQKLDAAGTTNRDWPNFARVAREKAAELGHVAILNDGSYLLPLNAGLRTLSTLVLCAQEWRIQSQTLFFDHKPAWVISKLPPAP